MLGERLALRVDPDRRGHDLVELKTAIDNDHSGVGHDFDAACAQGARLLE
jgi:hypothetical protein